VLGLGALYKSFNSYVSRTLLIDPSEQQKSTYKKILTLGKGYPTKFKARSCLDTDL
jgi:nucleosome binding factor SPN SPT16 subunit